MLKPWRPSDTLDKLFTHFARGGKMKGKSEAVEL